MARDIDKIIANSKERKKVQNRKYDALTEAALKQTGKWVEPSRVDQITEKSKLRSTIGLDTFEADLKTLGTTVEGVYKGWQNPTVMRDTRASIESMQKRISAYQTYREKYGNGGGADLTKLSNSYKEILGDWDSRTQYYGGYGSAEEYNTAETNRKKLLDADIEGLTKELEHYKNVYDAAKTTYDNWNVPNAGTPNHEKMKETGVIAYYTAAEESAAKKERDEFISWAIKDNGINMTYDELIKYVEEKQSFIDQAKHYQNFVYLNTNDVSLEELGSHLKDEDPIAYTTPDGQNVTWQYLYDHQFADEDLHTRYEEYSKRDDWEEKSKPDSSQGGIGGDSYYRRVNWKVAAEDDSFRPYNTEEERAIYNYLYATEGSKVANEWHKSREFLFEERKKERVENLYASFAKKLPVISDIVSIPLTLVSGLEYAGNLINGEGDKTVYTSLGASTIRNTRMEQIDLEIAGWDAFDFVYGTGMSALDSLAATAVFAPLGAGGAVASKVATGASSLTLGLSAAAQGTNEALERGLTGKDAFWHGLASGLTETVFEYVSIGNMKGLQNSLNDGTFKTLAKNLSKSMLVNASEETFTEVANIAYDTIANTDFSQYETLVRQYTMQGMSVADAKAKAKNDLKNQVVEAMAGGAFMGLGFGIYGNHVSNKKTKALYGDAETAKALVAQGLESAEGSESYALAQEYQAKIDSGKSLSGAELTRLVSANSSAIKSEAKTSAETMLKNLGESNATQIAEIIAKKSAGEELTKAEVKALKNSEYGMRVYNEINYEDLSGYTEGMSDQEKNLFLSQYDESTNANANDYANSFNLALDYSKNNFTPETILKNKGVLTNAQVNAIYKSTVIDAVKSQQAAIDKLNAKYGKTMTYVGTIDDSIIDYTNSTKDGKKVNWNSLNSSQRKAVTFMTGLAKATGMNLKLIKNGLELGINGAFDVKNGVITLDIYAGMDKITGADFSDTIIPTASHEMTHWMKDKAPALYRKIDEHIFNTLMMGGKTEQEILAARRARMEAAHPGVKYTDAEVRDEVIARACEDMLAMSKEGKELFNSLSENEKKSFVDKVKDIIQNLKDWISDLLSNYKSNSPEAKLMREYKDQLEKLSALWDEMLRQSIQTNQSLKKEGITDEELAKSANKDVKLSHRDVERGKKRYYNELNSLAMQWANSAGTEQGDYNSLYDSKSHKWCLAVADKNSDGGYRIVTIGNYKEVKELEQIYNAENEGFDRYAETYKSIQRTSDSGLWESPNREMFGRDSGTANPKQEEIKGNTSTKDAEHVWSDNRKTSAQTKNSDRDTLGNTLTESQQSYFKDSKVRDENGNLKVMYRGDANEFTVFDKKKTNHANLYGRGFYFTDSKSHAGQYGSTREFYLDIKNPLSPAQNNITKSQMLNFLKAIENDGEDYDLYNYGQGATAESVLNSVWGKGDFEMLQDISAGAIGDLVAATELFNEVNGTTYDGIILPTETITFKSEQAKLTSNKNPTTDKDIRYADRDSDVYSRISEMQTEVNQLGRKIKEIESNKDFKAQMDSIFSSNDDIEIKISKYQKLLDESEYGKLKSKRDALQIELENLRKSFAEDSANKALAEEKEAIAKSGLNEADYFRKEAVKEFGYTPYFYDAGYIVPNGRMLNFSGEKGKHFGSRGEDHRAIGIIYANTQGTAALTRFMNDGNIRIMAESPGIDVSAQVAPTNEQYSTIRKFVYEYAKEGFFNVDISDESGKVIGSLEYENNINPTRIINDIKHYYATGEIRQQSDVSKFLYSDRDSNYMDSVNNGDVETAQRLVDKVAKESGAILDENGNPLKLYRGTKGGQTVFAKENTLNGKIYTIDNINIATQYGDKSGKATEISNQVEGEPTTYALYGFPKKVLTLDAQFGVWSDLLIPEELRKYSPNKLKATNAQIAEWAEMEGYDALRINNVRDGSIFAAGDEIIFFNENLVKSADAITKDNNGEVIPLSQRFNEGNDDIRYSDRDSEGNTLTKEQIEFFKDSKVRDENGNLKVMYHGTENIGFTVFDTGYSDDGISLFFTDNLKVAKGYSGTYDTFIPDRKLTVDEMTQELGDSYYFVEENDGKYEIVHNKHGDFEVEYSADSYEEMMQHIREEWSGVQGSGNYKVYLNLTNPLVIDADGHSWDDIEYNGQTTTTRDISKHAKENGFDGVIFNNLYDNALHAAGDERFIQSTVAVAFNSNQVKSVANNNPTKNADIRYSDRDNVSVYDKMGETNRLAKENEQLKEDVERLKERLKIERQVTNGNYFNRNQLDAVAGHIRKIANSDYSKKDLVSLLDGVYSYIAHSPDLNWDDLYSQCYDVAKTVLDEARPITVSNDYSKMILKDIRNANISVNETQIKDAEYKLGRSYRKAFFGKVNITDSGTSLDSKWKEWSDAYPDIFDSNLSDADQLAELYDIYESLKDDSEMLVEYDTEEQTRWLAKEIYNQYWNVSTIRTTADKYDKQIKRLNFEHRKAMTEFRDSYEERLAEQKRVDKAKYTERIKAIRERKDREIAEIKKLSEKRMDAYKERAERKTTIQSITSNALTLNKWLVKNSKTEHIHEAMKGPVINLLQAIDFSSKQMLEKHIPTQNDVSFAKAFAGINEMLIKANNAEEELVELYGHDLADGIKMLMGAADRLVGDNNYVINKMSLEELQQLDRLVKYIKKVVTDLNKFHVVNHAKGIASLSQEEILYADNLGKAKVFDPKTLKAKARKLLSWDNVIPYYAFKRFGAAGQKIFEAFQDGWDKLAFHSKEIIDFSENVYTSEEIKAWEEEIKSFDVLVPATKAELEDPNYKPQYQAVQMSIPQIMSLYCLQKRQHAIGHILGGGIRVANIKQKNGKIISQEDGFILSEKDIKTIVSTLSNRQIEVADALQKFMNTTCSDWGNEVSMLRFGYKAFGEENYFPIQSDKNNLAVEDETEKSNSLFQLLNMSFTKSIQEGANNRIVISDIFDVFAQHAADMAKYNALALPVLDAFRWYNYTEKGKKGETQYITKSVKTSIEKAFGEEGKKYITTFLKDINGQKNVSRDTLGKGFFSKAKVASVAMNLRVMALQPTAYLKASAIIDNKYLTKALAHKPKIGRAEKYCGMALWKSLGYYDTDISKGLTEKIKHAETWKDKAVDKSLKGAEWADKVTFGYLWNACELEIRDTRKDLKVGSEEFYEAIGKRLREVIYATQVVDSTMTRSQMMRGSGMYEKMITAFSSEPTLAYNMVQDVYMEMRLDGRKNGKKIAFKKHGKKAMRVLWAYTITNAVAALIESGFDAFRDDDDEEMDVEEFMMLYLKNFYFDMSLTAKVPYLKEALSMAQGFSSSRSDTQWMQYAVNTIKGLWKITQGEGDVYSSYKNLLRTLSYLSGLPFYNAHRDLMATLNKLEIFTTEDIEEMFGDSED